MNKFLVTLCLAIAIVGTHQSSFRNTEIKVNDIPSLEAFDFGKCLNAAMGLIMPVTKLVTDIKEGRKDFETIKGDVTGILSNTNSLCDGCSIPRPSNKEGPIDMQKCLLDFDIIATSAEKIIKNKNNMFVMIAEIQNLVSQGPTILMDCGIKI